MSEEIPKSPLLMRLYSSLRDTVTPTHNVLYILVEQLIFALVLSSGLYYYFNSGITISAIPVVISVIVWISILISTQPSKKMKEQYVMTVGFKSFLVLLVVVSIPVVVYYYFRGYTDNLTVIGSAFFTYLLTFYGRSRKYLGERDYFTDNYSEASQEWYMASVALEKAISQAEKENAYRAHYWSSKAQGIYEKVVEKEERTSLREAAGAFSAGCEFLSVSVFTDGSESYSYHSAAQQSFERAAESLSRRVCDNCGRRRKLDRCQRLVRDGEKYIYCETCKQNAETKRQRSSSKSQGEQQTDEQESNREKSKSSERRERGRSTSSGRRSRSTRESTKTSGRSGENSEQSSKSRGGSASRKSSQSDEMTKKKALEVLRLSEPIEDTSEVHSAFRRNVKNAHPDTGGSEEEFKKVKKAREVLLDNL